jgi:hypothetical protein
MSREHAAHFRLEFLNLLSENAVCDLTRIALLVAAEDDSIGVFFISYDSISVH